MGTILIAQQGAPRRGQRLLLKMLWTVLCGLLAAPAAWAAEVTADLSPVQTHWEARYTVKGPLNAWDSVNLLFPANLYSAIAVTVNPSSPQLSPVLTPPSPGLGAPGELLLTAEGLALAASDTVTLTVSFNWLGTGTPGNQNYELLDSNFNVTATALVARLDTASITPHLIAGWQLLGNSLTTPIDIVALFGNADHPTSVSGQILSVWKWQLVNGDGKWAFYSPSLTATENASYSARKGYDVLTSINPKEGFWVNAGAPTTLPTQTGTLASFTYANDFVGNANWPRGFNLIAIGGTLTPTKFNDDVAQSPPRGTSPMQPNFVSLWVWDANLSRWYFYAPNLEVNGGLAAVKTYAESRGYLDFNTTGRSLEPGVGFWVNR